MDKINIRTILRVLIITLISSCFNSCGSLEQWSQGLQAVGNSLSGATYYTAPTTNYSTNTYTTTSSSEKEWHDCSSCSGTGRCKYCGGSGHNDYTKNKKCGVCKGTGKCAGCNGRGGWTI